MRNRNKLSDSFRRLCHLIHFYLLHFALAIIVSHKIDVLQTRLSEKYLHLNACDRTKFLFEIVLSWRVIISTKAIGY